MPSENTAIADIVALATNKPLRLVESNREVAVVPPLQRPPVVATPRYEHVERVSPAAHVEHLDETWAVTRPAERAARDAKTLKVAIGAGAFALVGVMIGGYLAFDGEGGKHIAAAVVAAAPAAAPAPVAAAAPAPAAAPPAAPAPAAAPPAAPAPAASPAPAAPAPAASPAPAAAALVSIRLDSTPPGASATLVDNGRPRELGSTPVDVSLDPSHAYDVVFTLDGHPTRIEHFDPSSTQRVAVELDPPAVAAATHPARSPARTKPHRAARAHHVATSAASASSAQGTLMVSSKPPCELVIDGKSTGLVTPQRSIPLPAGAHTVTFVNSRTHLKKSRSVKITANRSTKLLANFM